MPRTVSVHLLPALFEPTDLRGGVAVVIDVLRASTTICHALAAGAECVVPCRTVEEAQAVAAGLPPDRAVLGGERGGLRIDGFDLGNSPADYNPTTVGGKMVVFTTTNGTAALARCREADAVYIGAFVNLQRILDAVCDGNREVHLVCAGTDGVVTAEDVLLAGAVAVTLGGQFGNDSGRLAVAAYQQLAGRVHAGSLVAALRESRGGANLAALGLVGDIAVAAAVDAVPVLPRFDPATGRITAG